MSQDTPKTATPEPAPPPPVAERRPHSFSHHGITVEDPYHWLKDQDYPTVDDPDVLDYLNAENAYFEAWMGRLQPQVDSLFTELKNRQPEEDHSVPYRRGDYRYQWRFESGAQYRRWYRAPVARAPVAKDPLQPEDWQLILDEVQLAADTEYFRLGGLSVSPDGKHLAWSSDTDGSERFILRIKNLASNTVLPDQIEQTLGAPVWANDNQSLVYLRVNENWRPYQVRVHELGAAVEADSVIYEESDPSFFVGIDMTQSRRWLLISAGDHVTNEIRFVSADAPLGEQTIISPRRAGHEYDVDHREGWFYVRTNDQHKNFRLARAKDSAPQPEHWETLIEGSDRHYLRGVQCFKTYTVVVERDNGLDQIRILTDPHTEAGDHNVAFPETAYTASLGTNAEYDQPLLRLNYESMVTPDVVYDYDLQNRTLKELKVQEIPSGYDRSQYETRRLLAPARDGERIPVSIVYKRGFKKGPLYLYAYGAYGYAVPPSFSPNRLSLLNRGFAFAIAHIRGGDDLGYRWYEDGKLDKRTNTFNDFVDVAQFLIDEDLTSAGQIAIAGGSAGGELVGAAVNQAPQLWGAVAAHVPFVDVLNTMLDTSLPLTPIEWPEWGNPIEDKTAFEFIRSYSPYDQLAAGKYPPILVTAGLNDPRVTYWEPAKYVAKIRHLKTGSEPLLLKTNMGAGHGGKSGRFDSLRETAEEYAFILDMLGTGVRRDRSDG